MQDSQKKKKTNSKILFKRNFNDFYFKSNTINLLNLGIKEVFKRNEYKIDIYEFVIINILFFLIGLLFIFFFKFININLSLSTDILDIFGSVQLENQDQYNTNIAFEKFSIFSKIKAIKFFGIIL